MLSYLIELGTFTKCSILPADKSMYSCSVRSIGKLSCSVWAHWEAGSSFQTLACCLKVSKERKKQPQIQNTVSLRTAKPFPTDLTAVYHRILRFLQWEREARSSDMASSCLERRLNWKLTFPASFCWMLWASDLMTLVVCCCLFFDLEALPERTLPCPRLSPSGFQADSLNWASSVSLCWVWALPQSDDASFCTLFQSVRHCSSISGGCSECLIWWCFIIYCFSICNSLFILLPFACYIRNKLTHWKPKADNFLS